MQSKSQPSYIKGETYNIKGRGLDYTASLKLYLKNKLAVIGKYTIFFSEDSIYTFKIGSKRKINIEVSKTDV